MAGHSKWANIQHRKNRQDAKRGLLWTKLIREITVAARDGGGDPGMNPRLRLAMEKASAGNVPKDTVNKAIQRGSGRLEGVSYEEIRYEGYGAGGAAIIVDCLTDNRTRTVAEVRHAFSKFGGNLGTDGSVAYQFRHCGQFVFAPGTPEDRVFEVGLEAGADDVQRADDGSVEVVCAPGDFEKVRQSFVSARLVPEVADITMKALNEVALQGDEAQKMKRLLEALEDLDDVQHVYTSAAIDDES
jgi:YebC/PmpR family DNA-binding regulatory protein